MTRAREQLRERAEKSLQSAAERLKKQAAADEIRAVFPAGTFRADCLGNVNVAWGESHLKCTKLSIIGAVNVPDPTVEGATDDGSLPSDEVVVEGVRVAGEGDVVFRRGEFLAKCGYFTFDDETGMLELMPDVESEIEIDFGEEATMWAERVIVDEKNSSVECVSPQVVLLVDDSFMGFRETGRTAGGSSATRAKIDLSAGGSLTLEFTTAESARLDFTGGVEATRWDSSTTLEDKITCERLELDAVIEPKGPGEDLGRTKVIAARATGGVYLRYLGPKATLEGRGDRFEWGDREDLGKLSGSPATVWLDGEGSTSVQNADEFIYHFSDQSIEISGGGAGTLTIDRTARQ